MMKKPEGANIKSKFYFFSVCRHTEKVSPYPNSKTNTKSFLFTISPLEHKSGVNEVSCGGLVDYKEYC